MRGFFSKRYVLIMFVVLSIVLAAALAACGDKNIGEPNEDILEQTVKEEISETANVNEENKESVNEEKSKEGTTDEGAVVYPLKIKDAEDKEITIDKEPMRVISMGPNITETIYALEVSDKLVGRTDYCNYPQEVESVATVGSIRNPNLEVIAELKPDLVIASTHFKDEVKKKLEEIGIKVVVFYSRESFEGVYDTIQNTAEVLNAKKKAGQVISGMKEKVDSILTKVNNLPAPSVYYVVGLGSKDSTAGRGTFIAQMLEMAGGENAADDVEGWTYSLEKLVEKDPDILICSKYYNMKQEIQAANGYRDLTAVKNGRLFEIDNNMLDRQGPRLADGLEALARIIHPDVFE